MSDIMIQGIGFLAMAAFLLSYQIKSNKGLLISQSIGNFLFGLQYVLMNGVSGGLTSILIIVRNIQIMYKSKHPILGKPFWPVLYLVFDIVLVSLSWTGLVSLLPLLAFTAGTLMYWSDNAQKIRLANLMCCCPSWLIYDVLTGSIAGIINETLAIISILISIFRYGWRSLGKNRFDSKSKG